MEVDGRSTIFGGPPATFMPALGQAGMAPVVHSPSCARQILIVWSADPLHSSLCTKASASTDELCRVSV